MADAQNNSHLRRRLMALMCQTRPAVFGLSRIADRTANGNRRQPSPDAFTVEIFPRIGRKRPLSWEYLDSERTHQLAFPASRLSLSAPTLVSVPTVASAVVFCNGDPVLAVLLSKSVGMLCCGWFRGCWADRITQPLHSRSFLAVWNGCVGVA